MFSNSVWLLHKSWKERGLPLRILPMNISVFPGMSQSLRGDRMGIDLFTYLEWTCSTERRIACTGLWCTSEMDSDPNPLKEWAGWLRYYFPLFSHLSSWFLFCPGCYYTQLSLIFPISGMGVVAQTEWWTEQCILTDACQLLVIKHWLDIQHITRGKLHSSQSLKQFII